MKILNLYSGVGGNRKLWPDNHQVTAVEIEEYIAEAYREMFPQDEVIVTDAHQFLLDNHKDFDFIWSSPPCPTHSRVSTGLYGWGITRYPDMKLYQEIIFLGQFFKGYWSVENVLPYYTPLIQPEIVIDRHCFWSNFKIPDIAAGRKYDVSRSTKETLAEALDIEIPAGTKDKRKLLRNCVQPKIGLHILNCVSDDIKLKPVQQELFCMAR